MALIAGPKLQPTIYISRKKREGPDNRAFYKQKNKIMDYI